MSSTTETGHAKNVAIFDDLISFVMGYGTAYNPSKASITLPSLHALSKNAKIAISDLHVAFSVNSNASAAREVAFEPLNKLSTRVLNALRASDTSTQVDESARTLVRKIHGSRAKAKLTSEEKDALAAEGTVVKEISSSQMSYDSRLDNFDKLIRLVESIALYAPNEPELKVTGLTALFGDMVAQNTEVITTTMLLSNSRISRNEILYKADAGLVDTALAVKNYIKSLYGSTSPQYKQVSRLEFKNR